MLHGQAYTVANIFSRWHCPSGSNGSNSTKRILDNKLITYEIVAVLGSTRLLDRVINSDLKSQCQHSKYLLYKKPSGTVSYRLALITIMAMMAGAES